MLTIRKTFLLDGDVLYIVFDGSFEEDSPFIGDESLSVDELSNITYALDWFDYIAQIRPQLRSTIFFCGLKKGIVCHEGILG